MTPVQVLIPADIRFPLERANGVQIVKTAAALARAGCRARLLVRDTDPRETGEILALYGLAGHDGLDVRRLGVLHRPGSFALPRASFLAQASALASSALRNGGLVYTRDLQLADVLLGLGPLAAGPIVYEAHAVEALMYRERGALYGTAEAPKKRKVARLVILGGLPGEADLERVRALVAASGLEPRTEMPGTVSQARVAEEMRRASVVVAPFLRSLMTERHTSPLKAFEAMAAGRPVIASDLPSSREFLRDGENALLVPPGDAGALADAITRVLEDRGLAAGLARTAFEEAPRYSWDARARALVSLFEEVR